MALPQSIVAVLGNLEDDSHVRTRLNQYEAINNKKGIAVAKQFLLSKLEGQNKVLIKHGLEPFPTATVVAVSGAVIVVVVASLL